MNGEPKCLTCLRLLTLDWIPDTAEGGGGIMMCSCGWHGALIAYAPIVDPKMEKNSERLIRHPEDILLEDQFPPKTFRDWVTYHQARRNIRTFSAFTNKALSLPWSAP